ncbi:hypothetical protein M0L70_RS16470 [Providencia rettgeri]|nr:hypothetical protein [Providencia rettgeri]
MSFISMNCPFPEKIKKEISLFKKNVTLDIEGNIVELFYSNQDWLIPPVYEDNNQIMIISGWFINSNYKRNDIMWLFEKIASLNKNEILYNDISNEIISGQFLCISFNKKTKEYLFFTDPFSLTPHYYHINDTIKISPSPSALSLEKDDELYNILMQQGHLFGKYTAFKNVFRFIPGDIILFKDYENHKVVSNRFNINNLHSSFNVVNEAARIIATNKPEQQSIAISAGFDSRLLLSVSQPAFTYTWGPKSSLDVKNGEFLSKIKNIKHYSFPFKKNKIEEIDSIICQYFFEGSVKKYNTQFYTNYKYVSSLNRDAYIAIDGYLGDVLQRGVYMTFGGIKGEILKIFPSLTPCVTSPESLLRKRYRNVSTHLFSLIQKDFNEKTQALVNISELQKVTYYEFLFGRGLRYITTGAINMNSVFKTISPVFASRHIFCYFISKSSSELLSYKAFKQLWHDIEPVYQNMISEGYYSPNTPRILIPYCNFLGRIITAYLPQQKNYTRE